MTTLTHPDRVEFDFSHPFAHWREAWSHLNPRHGAGVLLAALVMTVVDWSIWIDKAGKPGVGKMFAFDVFVALLLFTLTLLAWSIASYRAPADRGSQRRRLLVAIVGSAALTAVITVPLMGALGIDQIIWEMMEKKKALPPASLVILSNAVQYAVFSFMFVAALEVMRRRAVTQAALHGAQHDQVVIARQVLESRLAAMQAQVEPQFLFDTLVDVEALYRADAPRAADNLDGLITYLRVALPRLRETGSTIEAEIELVQAYLEVVRARHNGLPRLSVDVDESAGSHRFFPMLLLPLVQRAVRQQDDHLPPALSIEVRSVDDDLVVEMRIEQFGTCREDAELVRVRERLAGLYGARASLTCTELPTGTAQFTMRVPADPNR